MEAVRGVKSAVETMTLRIDGVAEGQPKVRVSKSNS